MLPALTTKPKQAVRQVKGLTNDSIDSYANTPLGGSGIGGGMAASYVDNTESGSGTARGSPPASSRATVNTGRATVAKPSAEEGATMARVIRDRKASGEEELSLRTGDVVKVLSTKRTGYLKCEAGDEVGYVPSSYLEFLDGAGEAETSSGAGNAALEEAQRAEKQRKKQQRKEKRKKEKKEANEASDPEEGAPVSARSPRKEAPAEDEANESPRKGKKKNRKHRQDREALEASGVEEPSSSARSRAAPEETERSRSKSKRSKKKRNRDAESSESSESDGGKRSARHCRRRRHRRGSSGSDSDSTSSDDSDGSYRRRRRHRRHKHRRSSSEEEDEDDSDYKRRARRGKKRRDKGDGDSEPEEGSRSARKAERKKLAAAVEGVEKGMGQLDVKSDEKVAESAQAKTTTTSSTKDEPDRDKGKEQTQRSEGSSEGRASSVSTSRKDDEGRASTSTSSSSQKQNGSKAGIGRQLGEKMRSFLGGSKKQHSSKSSSGILNACPGTVQGEEGWYEHGENERYYFVLVDGKWSLLYGPMTEDDYEVFSNRVLEQNRAIELPPTYLHKTGYYLNRELRVQKDVQ